MKTSQKRFVAITSLNDLLESFLVDVPPEFRFEPTRLQLYPIQYFLPFLRVPTPLNVAPFSYLILQGKGKGEVQINADRITIRSRAAMFVHRGSVVSLRSLHPSTTGWMVMYDDALIARVLHSSAIEQVFGMRTPIPLSRDAYGWLEELSELLQRQTRIETTTHQPVSDHLFGALIQRLLAEGGVTSSHPVDRAESLDHHFRQLVFEHAIAEGSVGFYAERLHVSENYLLQCIKRVSGRSPKEWILDVRMMYARKLLQTTGEPVGEIAAQTGFDDPSYFGRLFRRRFGMSPREFRTISEQDLSG
jgi:AraC family transcriptional regulator, transcriptional activator of pobA